MRRINRLMDVFSPGATIGIIGGGQLGKMAAIAASHMGYKTHIYSPVAKCPAAQVASRLTVADYDDADALAAFAKTCDVITFEFENIPATSVARLTEHAAVYPHAEVLEVSQNRLREKAFINERAGVPTAAYIPIRSLDELTRGLEKLGTGKAILKTTQFGYDGKGQWVIDTESVVAAMYQETAGVELILEDFIPFQTEISVIIARNGHGETAAFPPAENTHKGGILRVSKSPASLDSSILNKATQHAEHIIEALDMRGLLAIEFFVTEAGDLLVNEIAPRPHNSGHWTMDGCITCQFEQFIRAVCGLPLGSVEALAEVEMINLIGEDVEHWERYLENPLAKLYNYGKGDIREGRKMGHVNLLMPPKSA